VTHLRALLSKELLDVSRNRSTLLPAAVASLMALAIPFAITLAIPALTGEGLGDDTDLVRVSRAVEGPDALGTEGRIQLFFFQQFLLLFVVLPLTGAMALAAHSVVGEKQARTLEPLLATPITTLELLVAKVLGALLPTLAISTAGLVAYFGLIGLLAEPGVATAMFDARALALVALVGPASALASLQVALLVSSRANDARTAQQFGVLIILPMTGLLVAQFAGAVWLSAGRLGLIGLGLLALWAVLALVSVLVFDRETILTRWR
jgi:ABC-2 type transport system permease protein